MIAAPSGLRVLLATRPVDFRKGMDGFAALVKERLGADPFSGKIFVFQAKRADRADCVGWNGIVPVRQAARAERIPLAEDRGRGDPSDASAVRGVDRGA